MKRFEAKKKLQRQTHADKGAETLLFSRVMFSSLDKPSLLQTRARRLHGAISITDHRQSTLATLRVRSLRGDPGRVSNPTIAHPSNPPRDGALCVAHAGTVDGDKRGGPELSPRKI